MVGLRCCVDKEHCNRNVGVERWPMRLPFGEVSTRYKVAFLDLETKLDDRKLRSA